jgi:glyoxylase-like metal-dependent hydrolase (beta-lactamase superfamily II)
LIIKGLPAAPSCRRELFSKCYWIKAQFMRNQIVSSSNSRAGRPESSVIRRSGTNELLPDLACKRIAIVNVAFFGVEGAGDREWVLIDAGLPGTARLILRAAEKRFGRGSRPAAIILTHGHFDHVGGIRKLADFWDAPVFAHPQEFPFLNGTSSYPAPDPTVGGGLMASLSSLYPRGPIDVSDRLQMLPENEAPFMPGWTWIHTPGHSPGHVSLWRESDRTLIAGDAFITTNQESAYSVAVQRPEMHGPPTYYTPDWQGARASVEALAALDPETVITGHGPAMRGSEMRGALRLLAEDFDRIAVPEEGRYVHTP